MGDKLSRGQAHDWRTDGHTHRQTDAGNNNTRMPKLASGNKTIQTAKKEYYFTEFSKYKHDIRKTWDTIKEVICKNKTKAMLPSYLYNKWIAYSNNHAIDEKLNEYFTEVGPELAKSIPRPQNPNSSFKTYLRSPCSSIFTFEYTNPDKISKHIQSLKPKILLDMMEFLLNS